jgi:thymidylate synthase
MGENLVNSIYANNIPQAYTEAIIKLRTWGEEQESRNGPVITSIDPVYLEIQNPKQRVLFDQTRNANPFFHVMEFVWMMAGENDVRWIEQFNHGFRNYADHGTNTLHGAYGHRWTRHFEINQIVAVADLLRADKTTRRAVLGMWDPRVDLSQHSDLPCNTQIMFRVVHNALDMTVINRSNDLIWGMLGANAVHMTYLHELIAFISGIKIGLYKVFTNNLHIYKEMPNFKKIWATITPDDFYRANGIKTYDLLWPGEKYETLVRDCVALVNEEHVSVLETNWARAVAWPMKMAYQDRLRLTGGDGKYFIAQINAEDWRLACENYVNLREGKEK